MIGGFHNKSCPHNLELTGIPVPSRILQKSPSAPPLPFCLSLFSSASPSLPICLSPSSSFPPFFQWVSTGRKCSNEDRSHRQNSAEAALYLKWFVNSLISAEIASWNVSLQHIFLIIFILFVHNKVTQIIRRPIFPKGELCCRDEEELSLFRWPGEELHCVSGYQKT